MKLKPCPWCQGTKFYVFPQDSHLTVSSVICESCGAEGPTRKTKEEAMTAWNTRLDGWIECNDRLPDLEGEYDVSINFGSDRRVIVALWDSIDEFFFAVDEGVVMRLALVTHWRKRPEPPAGKEVMP